MKHTLINIALFAGVVAAMVGIQAVDATDHSEEHQVASEELAKQRREERFITAAQAMCGNGGFVVDGDTVRCINRKTKVAMK